MKIEYCHQCKVRIEESDFTDGAVHVEDKPYCSECAPLFGATSSILMKLPATDEDPGLLAKPDGSKFWFCESCNKRLTEVDLAEGKGFDKQLRGKYCMQCAPGVSTQEFTPLRDPVPHPTPPKKHLPPHPKPAPAREKPGSEKVQEAKKGGVAIHAAYASLVVAVGIAVWVFASRDKADLPAKPPPAAQPVTNTAANSPTPAPVSVPVEPSVSKAARGKKINVPRTKEFRIELGDGVFMDFVLIPAGKFSMGSPADEPSRSSIEAQHEVTLTRSFYMARLETQQAQYQSLMGNSEKCYRRAADPMAPAVAMFERAQKFCQELSERLDLPAELPTEAEWEYACRAGTTGAFNVTGKLDDFAWYQANSEGKPRRCGEKQPNAWGLFDMHGNEREWVVASFGPYPAGPQTDPVRVQTNTNRVLRGGNYSDEPDACRSAYRRSSLVQYPNGFRVIIRLPQ